MAYSTQLPSGAWQGGFRLPSGKKVTRSRDEAGHPFDFEYEAIAWAEAAEKRAKSLAAEVAPAAVPGQRANASSVMPTLAAYGRTWIERNIDARNWAPATVDQYRSLLSNLGALGKMRVDEVTNDDVVRWMGTMTRAGVAPSTRGAKLGRLRSVYNDAIKRGIVTANPTADIVKPRPGLKADATISRAQEPALMFAAAATGNPDVEVMLLLGIDAGLRISEVLGLPGSSVIRGEDGRHYLDLFQQLSRKGGVVNMTKGHRKRTVPLTPRLVEVLVPMAEVAGSGLLFTNRDGDALDYHNFRRRVWQPLMNVVGLTAGTHDLRHTYGSRLAAAGVPRSEIAKVMGHADESTTARYIHAADDGVRHDLVLAALGGSPPVGIHATA